MFPGTGEAPSSTLSESVPEISIVLREENIMSQPITQSAETDQINVVATST